MTRRINFIALLLSPQLDIFVESVNPIVPPKVSRTHHPPREGIAAVYVASLYRQLRVRCNETSPVRCHLASS